MVRKYASDFPNIHFHPAIKPSEILSYTCSADVGLSIIENSCLSYYYSLPNKFFEYIAAGVPVIASDFPDMSAIVNEHKVGWTVDVNEEALSNLIAKLTDVELKQPNTSRITVYCQRYAISISKRPKFWDNSTPLRHLTRLTSS
jgi:glycosyltransferase involved in cell wall biosynthesis